MESERVGIPYGFNNLRRLYLIDITANGTHLVDVILILVTALILRLSYKPVPYYQAQLYEQLHRVVEGRP